MMGGLIGRKIGMTQVFDEDGRAVPVTVIQAGPCVVVQRKTRDHDGYEAAQLGLVESGAGRKTNKPLRGHFEKAGVAPTRVLLEFRLAAGEDPKPGDTLNVADVFEAGAEVEVVGRSKGKGFQGVIKRHGFGGGRSSHGSMFHRAPGSIGQSAFPSKVLRGMRGPGQTGHARRTVPGLKVVSVDGERNLVLVRGAVPGAKGSLVVIRKRHHVGAAAAGE